MGERPKEYRSTFDALASLGLGSGFAASSQALSGLGVSGSAAGSEPRCGYLDAGTGGSGFAAKPAAAASPKPKPTAATSAAQSLLDWDEFESAPAAAPAATHGTFQNDPLEDFDFGNREDGLLGNQSGDEDDILGDLGKPIEQLQAVRVAVLSCPA